MSGPFQLRIPPAAASVRAPHSAASRRSFLPAEEGQLDLAAPVVGRHLGRLAPGLA